MSLPPARQWHAPAARGGGVQDAIESQAFHRGFGQDPRVFGQDSLNSLTLDRERDGGISVVATCRALAAMLETLSTHGGLSHH